MTITKVFILYVCLSWHHDCDLAHGMYDTRAACEMAAEEISSDYGVTGWRCHARVTQSQDTP